MKTTADVCKEAGLTYDGFCIGLPEEYYKENYPKEYLKDKIAALIKREIENENDKVKPIEVYSAECEEALKRLLRL